MAVTETLLGERGIVLVGKEVQTGETYEILSPYDGAPVEYAAERIAWGGFTNAGQTCTSVQRVFVHEDVHDEFVADLVRPVEELKVGDPLDEDTDVGPMIGGA
jgi:delta 1-pyrroline-5-carboxylate dehydrogenase